MHNMIATVQPLHSGNALRLFIEPPTNAVWWRVLRKGSDSFSGATDASAFIAYEGDEKVVVDSAYLQNNVMAYYKPYYTHDDGLTWTAGATAHGTPSADYEEYTTDTLSIVRERIEAGLKVEVERGSLQSDLGYVQVYTAPPSLEQNLLFPLVTISLDSESSDIRALGESITGDRFDPVDFDWLEPEGWLANVQISITGWSLNSDERIELRKAIRRIVISNLPVFSAHGIEQVNLNTSHVDLVNGEYQTPMYQVSATFSCIAPVRVGGRVGAITDVTATITNQH